MLIIVVNLWLIGRFIIVYRNIRNQSQAVLLVTFHFVDMLQRIVFA